MSERSYWLDLFTWKTWQEFLDAGGTVSGFRESRWSALQKVRVGDYLLCYLTGVSRLIGLLEVTSEPYKDRAPIWKDDEFPARVRVRTLIQLDPETAVPILELRDQLSFFRGMKSGNEWTGAVRGSPSRWKMEDGDVVVHALEAASAHPIRRPVDPVKLGRRPRMLRDARLGLVSIPEPEEVPGEAETTDEPERPEREHTEIQWMLLKLGSDMGLDVWVARNDRGQEWRGQKFSELPRIKGQLPLQFDEITNRIVALIDVLWLKGNAIAAAFEIESTTSIYSGLLRMSDLVAMQPNLTIPLYLVAPEDRQGKVLSEINRPTFRRLSPPLSKTCRFISFAALRDKIKEVQSVIPYLRPDFLEQLSESCEISES